MFMLLLTVLFGHEAYLILVKDIVPLAFLPPWLNLQHMVNIFMLLTGGIIMVSNLVEIATNSKGIGHFFMNFLRMLPAVACCFSYFLIDQTDPFFQDNASLFFFHIGMSFTLITSKLIISTMAKMSYSPFQLEPVLLYLYWANSYFELSLPVSNATLFYATLGITLCLYLKFVHTAIT